MSHAVAYPSRWLQKPQYEVSYAVVMGTYEAKLVITTSSLIFVQHQSIQRRMKKQCIIDTVERSSWQSEPPNLVLHSSGLFLDLVIYFWYWGNELTWNTPIELITLNPVLNYGSLNFTLPSYHQTV